MNIRNQTTIVGIVAVLAAIGILSCGISTSSTRITVNQQYDPTDMQKYRKSGTGSINGMLGAKIVGGELRNFSGQKVYCYPATPYVRGVVAKLVIYEMPNKRMYALLHNTCTGNGDAATMNTKSGEMESVQFDSTFNSSICSMERSTTCDASSRFEFTDLPSGDYYLESAIWWMSNPMQGLYTGATVRTFVTVKDGEVTKTTMIP